MSAFEGAVFEEAGLRRFGKVQLWLVHESKSSNQSPSGAASKHCKNGYWNGAQTASEDKQH